MSAPLHKPHSHVSLIQLDSVALLVPQSNLHTVESILDINPACDGRSAGYIKLHGQQWPVYCSTDNLETVDEMTSNRRVCAMLIAGDILFGLMCQEVISAEAAQLRAFKLPACMRTPDTPLHGVGILGTRIVCLTSAPSLHALFTSDQNRIDSGPVSTPQSHYRGVALTDITEASA